MRAGAGLRKLQSHRSPRCETSPNFGPRGYCRGDFFAHWRGGQRPLPAARPSASSPALPCPALSWLGVGRTGSCGSPLTGTWLSGRPRSGRRLSLRCTKHSAAEGHGRLWGVWQERHSALVSRGPCFRRPSWTLAGPSPPGFKSESGKCGTRLPGCRKATPIPDYPRDDGRGARRLARPAAALRARAR
jgi:hypothetical protein